MKKNKMIATRSLAAVAASLLVAGSILSSAGVATADDGSSDRVEAFSGFVESLNFTPNQQETLKDRFEHLDVEEQLAFMDDPFSLVEFTTASEALTARGDTAARASVLEINDTQNAQFLGITLASLNLNYRYEANTANVTHNLSCNGSFSGFGLTGFSSPSNYVSSNGRGTCQVRTTINAVFQGSPIQFTKLHSFTTKQGNPRTGTATVSTV